MLSDKKLEKLHKTLGTETGELDALSPDQLKATILECEQQTKKLEDEMEANKEYIAAKEVLSDLRSSAAPEKRILKAKKDYCLHNLEGKGQ